MMVKRFKGNIRLSESRLYSHCSRQLSPRGLAELLVDLLISSERRFRRSRLGDFPNSALGAAYRKIDGEFLSLGLY